MLDYKKLLNQEQYDVVMNGDGPCLVLAGAGSGKTRTLVFRVAYLIEKGVNPQNILLVTFTNKAAKEMLGRVEKLLGFKPDDLFGGTFHRVGNLILRKHANKLGYERNFNILDRDDSASLIKHAMADLNLNVQGQNFPKAGLVHSIVSFARNSNAEIKEIAEINYGYPDFIADQIVEIAKIYEEKKKASNAMDFDDLLVNWLRLLERFPEILEKYSKQFQYILVDEYQDTNFIQAEIIKLLSGFHRNVLAVGDDSQSIYSFRAAQVKNILNFPKLFLNLPTGQAGAKIFKIETNYRSTPQILSLANNIIKHNIDQFEKKLVAVREDSCLPALIPCRDDNHQAHLIVKRIMELYRESESYESMAVLYRATYESAQIELELSKRNIPYVVRGGLRYFEQAHVKDILAYLKVLSNFQDEVAWKRVLALYDGIGEKTVDAFWKRIKKYGNLVGLIDSKIELKGKSAESWNKIVQTFGQLVSLKKEQKGFIGDAVERILESGYEDHLKYAYENYRERLDDITQLMNFVALYADLDKLLADVMLSENFAGDHAGDRPRSAEALRGGEQAVVLSTIHQAKGLEWPRVFIVGLRDGRFPHYKSMESPKELEEERRLFYVAVTRAKDELNMLYPIRSISYQFGESFAEPSMFIRELDDTKYTVEKRKYGYEEDEEAIEYD